MDIGGCMQVAMSRLGQSPNLSCGCIGTMTGLFGLPIEQTSRTPTAFVFVTKATADEEDRHHERSKKLRFFRVRHDPGYFYVFEWQMKMDGSTRCQVCLEVPGYKACTDD